MGLFPVRYLSAIPHAELSSKKTVKADRDFIIFEVIFAGALSGLQEALQELQLEQTTDRRPLNEDREGYDRVSHVDDRRFFG